MFVDNNEEIQTITWNIYKHLCRNLLWLTIVLMRKNWAVFLILTYQEKKPCIYSQLSLCHITCSSIAGKIFHTYDFSPVSTITINYLKSSSWLQQLHNYCFLHLVDESCYYRARWESQKHSILSPWFVILLQDLVQERGQSRAENERGTLYCIGF